MKLDNTTITISSKNRNKLIKYKYDLGCKTIDDVLDKIFNLITDFKLTGELKSKT